MMAITQDPGLPNCLKTKTLYQKTSWKLLWRNFEVFFKKRVDKLAGACIILMTISCWPKGPGNEEGVFGAFFLGGLSPRRTEK
jgi:hypothetical protein